MARIEGCGDEAVRHQATQFDPGRRRGEGPYSQGVEKVGDRPERNGFDAEADRNTLEVFISRLRRKLGRDRILTVRGTGYRLALEHG